MVALSAVPLVAMEMKDRLSVYPKNKTDVHCIFKMCCTSALKHKEIPLETRHATHFQSATHAYQSFSNIFG